MQNVSYAELGAIVESYAEMLADSGIKYVDCIQHTEPRSDDLPPWLDMSVDDDRFVRRRYCCNSPILVQQPTFQAVGRGSSIR